MANRTGADYITALRDGREVWHAGRRIEDVTTHPGFSGTIKTLADLYDMQHAPEYRDIMRWSMTASESRTATFRPETPKSSRASAATSSSGRDKPSARWVGIPIFARSWW